LVYISTDQPPAQILGIRRARSSSTNSTELTPIDFFGMLLQLKLEYKFLGHDEDFLGKMAPYFVCYGTHNTEFLIRDRGEFVASILEYSEVCEETLPKLNESNSVILSDNKTYRK